jgi:hypothetical protein
VTGSLRFNTIMLQEPPKAELLAFQHGAGPKPERRALVWVLNPPKGDFYEAVVGLPEGAAAGAGDVVRTWTKVRGRGMLAFWRVGLPGSWGGSAGCAMDGCVQTQASADARCKGLNL